jgi:ubiquinone/menaquinone biosynthesis C-methylase UbiE
MGWHGACVFPRRKEHPMDFNAQTVSNIYSSKLAGRYDFSMPHFFVKWKRRAVAASSLKAGDRVLVFCCGTGLDFAPILDIIGESGRIIGVDFSKEMLAQAAQKVAKHGWHNVELIEADVTHFHEALDEPADAGICFPSSPIIAWPMTTCCRT